ncbi:MAG: leucine-rich repeat protein [Muribaculaceae bacterium]|nr:leucine-rich repeat protein [Muribaculaceae bacterium]
MKTMKKIAAAALALLMSLATAQAQNNIIKGYVLINGTRAEAQYTKLSNNTVMLGTGQNACISQYLSGHLTIPGEITVSGTTYRVEEVGALAFRLCNKITGVEIKENVKRVGNFAFIGCPDIKEITLPASLESLGTGAFQSCAGSIESVTCLGTTPARWEYNDVFKFHAGGISDNKPELITAEVGLYVPEGTIETYHHANYTDADLGWTTPDGWSSFNNLNLGQAVFHIYLPSDLESLRDIVNYGNKYNTIRKTVLENDIDMSAYTWDKGIGYREEEPFLGNFYGNGHCISNLKVQNENGPGGLFAHFGGHAISDLTMKDCNIFGVGPTGALVGETGYCEINNVWVEDTRVVGGDYVGGLIGKCLTTGGANVYHSVVKNIHIGTTHFIQPCMGGLVGYCYGGKARNCAIIGDLPDPYYMELGVLGTNEVSPFVGRSVGNNDYYEENCYATSDYFENCEVASYEKPDYDLVVSTKKPLTYTATDGSTITTTYNSSTMKSLFMIPELGLKDWIYVPGEYPIPDVFADRVPVEVNKAVYCSPALAKNRVNGLALQPSTYRNDFLDLSPSGYRSGCFTTSQLWIDENFNYNPDEFSDTGHTPYLPIGTATIDAERGVRFDRTLEVTQIGTRPMTVPNAVLDNEGNPTLDDFGDAITDGTTTTVYERPLYADAANCIFLPYELTVNDGVEFFQPKNVSFNSLRGIVEMRLCEIETTEPWQPYYVVLEDAPLNLSNPNYLTIIPRPANSSVVFGKYNECTMQGTARPITATDPIRYSLVDHKTFHSDMAEAKAWSAFLTYDEGSTQNDFVVIREIPIYDDDNNSESILNIDGSTVDICLKGRTFYKDNTWYTLCLPFDVLNLTGTPLEGAALRTMGTTQFEDGTLTINFVEASSVQAGRPYLMKWPRAPKVDDPVFKDVTIRDIDPIAVTNGMVRFKGSFNPIVLHDNNKSILYLGDDNQLFYVEDEMQVNSCRAIFQLKKTAVADPNLISRIVLNFDKAVVTAIDEVKAETPRNYDDGWYTIDGRRLAGKPTAAGIYINQGKKILIK